MNKTTHLSKELSNQTLQVISIVTHDDKMIEKFSDIGLVVGQKIRIINHSKLNRKIIFIEINDVEYALRLADVENIKVKIIKGDLDDKK